MYFLPEIHGATADLITKVPQKEIDYATEHIVEPRECNEWEEYFDYVKVNLHLETPVNWKSALGMYCQLLDIAEDGYVVEQ